MSPWDRTAFQLSKNAAVTSKSNNIIYFLFLDIKISTIPFIASLK